MAHPTKEDLPGLHFSYKEGQESNVVFNGDPNGNCDIAQVYQGESQVILKDEWGFLWRVKADELNLTSQEKIIPIDLQAKLFGIREKIDPNPRLPKNTKKIFVVMKNQHLLTATGEEVPFDQIQMALWLPADCFNSLARAKRKLNKLFSLDANDWIGGQHQTRHLLLKEIPLDGGVLIRRS